MHRVEYHIPRLPLIVDASSLPCAWRMGINTDRQRTETNALRQHSFNRPWNMVPGTRNIGCSWLSHGHSPRAAQFYFAVKVGLLVHHSHILLSGICQFNKTTQQ